MLPRAARHVANRLITAVMTLIRALDAPATPAPLPGTLAETFALRLCQFALSLIHISNFGVRAPAQPKSAPQSSAPAAPPRPSTRRRAAPCFPRRPGWLLAALPDIAHPVAAEISALLADPAIATLLDRAPSLNRTLRTLLRALGIEIPPIIRTPPPSTSGPKPQAATPSNPAPPAHTNNPPTPARLKTSPTGQHVFSRPNCYDIATTNAA